MNFIHFFTMGENPNVFVVNPCAINKNVVFKTRFCRVLVKSIFLVPVKFSAKLISETCLEGRKFTTIKTQSFSTPVFQAQNSF